MLSTAYSRILRGALIGAFAFLFLASAVWLVPANAQSGATTITVYQSQHPVKLDGVVQPGEWSDTPIAKDPSSDLTYAFKQNGTGLLFLMEWSESSPCPTCFGGIELGYLNNTAVMGSSLTPTIMILAAASFKGNVDEFVSTGEFTPPTVESSGYASQTTCGLTYTNAVYTAECYRPFITNNATPYDVTLGIGTTVEIGFGVGLFNQPGNHLVTDMSSYVLTITNQTYTETSTSTSSSSSISTNSTSSSSNTTSTTTSTTASSSTSSSQTTSTASLPNLYAEELLVVVIGFSIVSLLVIRRYEK